MFYVMTDSSHLIYNYTDLDIWIRTTQIMWQKTHCLHSMDYSLAPRDLLHALSHRQDSIYHSFYYTSYRKGRKCFYLMTHSTQFIHSNMTYNWVTYFPLNVQQKKKHFKTTYKSYLPWSRTRTQSLWAKREGKGQR